MLLSACGQEQSALQAVKEQMNFGQHAPVSMGRSENDTLKEKDQSEREYHEFQHPTNNWMTNKGLGSTISTGIHRPGEEVRILMRVIDKTKAREIVTRTIRYKLTERDREGSLIQIVEEQTSRLDWDIGSSSFTPKLPNKEGAYYFLTAEIMAGSIVEDTVLSLLEVPIQKVEAELKLDQIVYTPNGKPTLTISNQGPASLFYGLDYRLERLEGSDWVLVPMGKNTGVPAIGYHLEEGNSWEQTLGFNALPLGAYRIGKEIEGTGTIIKKTLYVDFTVE
jgi:hypothetical protein